MINFETFKKLNTEEKFNLFEKVYQQNVKLNDLLENVTMRIDTHEKKLIDILRSQETNQVNNPNNVREIKDNQTQLIQNKFDLTCWIQKPKTLLLDRASIVE